jgi:hypothetical protein
LTARSPADVRWWQWPTVLSLDAPVVTVVWQRLFAVDTGAHLAWYHTVIVGASVWMAYAADRWLESWRVEPARLATPRHLFSYRHRRATAIGWSVALVCAIGLSLARLSTRELVAGVLLLVPTLAYVLSHQFVHRHARWRAPKELCVAGLITAAAALFPALDARVRLDHLADAAVWCFLLVVANCALIATWEQHVDRTHGQDSIVQRYPAWLPAVRAFPWVLAVAACALLVSGHDGAVVVRTSAAASALLFGLFDRMQPRLGWNASRLLADAALLTPLVWLAGAVWMVR